VAARVRAGQADGAEAGHAVPYLDAAGGPGLGRGACGVMSWLSRPGGNTMGGAMSSLRRAAGAAGRCVVWLMPARRREWAEALWAETGAVPPGRPRLAWRAGGLRLAGGQILTGGRVRRVLLFAAAAALMARAAWPGAAAGEVAAFARADVITTVLVLTALPLLCRWFFGPVQHSRLARFLRVSACAAVLALIPAKAAAERFAYAVPRNIHDRRLFLAVYGQLGPRSKYGTGEVVFLLVVALCLTAVFWMTSRRSSVTPATMAIGAGGGVLFGAVMYAVAPLGLNKYATNPWLPGSAVDPLVVLAWVLLFGGPVAVAILAGRRHPGPGGSGPFARTKVGQGFVAGVLANLSGALIVTVLGTGTIAAMLHAAWLRTWFDHGHHLNAVVLYSHELDASDNAAAYLVMCLGFPVIAMFMSILTAGLVWGSPSAAGQGGPPRGGGPGQPGPAPGQPGGGRPAETDVTVKRLAVSPVPGPVREDDEASGRGELVGAAAGGAMTRTC
jgi:hypothetical protein